MSFSPVVPLSGLAGWSFLKRTAIAQKDSFEATPVLRREEAYFRAKIGSVKTAEALVSDRRLLRVALGAFGLDADINNTFFIRKVLEDGTLDTGALANKLANKQYAALSKAFGFGDYSTPRTQLSDFASTILSAYKTRQFEVAVGESQPDLRLALNAERELSDLARKSSSEDTKWYTILGSAPLREVFETAFGLPSSFASVDLDQQLGVLKSRTARLLGEATVSQFGEAGKTEKLIRAFLARAAADAGTIAPGSRSATALQLLPTRGTAATILSLFA